VGRLKDEEVFEKGLDGGKALVTGDGTVSSSNVFVFEMLEEIEDVFDLEVFDCEGASRPSAGSEELKEETEGVPVAFQGEGAYAAVLSEIGEEERFEMRSQVVGHEGFLGIKAI